MIDSRRAAMARAVAGRQPPVLTLALELEGTPVVALVAETPDDLARLAGWLRHSSTADSIPSLIRDPARPTRGRVVIRQDPETGAWQFSRGDDWFTLRDPVDGPATERQQECLARLGLPAAPTKLAAARAIDEALASQESEAA